MDASMDLLLQGGRVIDPATGRDGIADVGVSDGRIVAVEPGIPTAAARQVIDVAGKIVIAGMIDTHAHVYRGVTGKFGLDPDMVGIKSGVTTVIDQGGPSCMTLPGFRAFIAEPAESRVLCFLSAYLVGGLEGHLYPELYGPEQVNVAATVKAARDNPDLVRGIKAHAEIGGVSRYALKVMKLGKEIAVGAGLPLYIHLGQLWPVAEGAADISPDGVVEELVPLMDAGDVLAHPFTRHPGGFISDVTGEVHPVVWKAIERGVLIDVGHGSHFSFAMARRVIAAGIKPDTLGADMHGYNVRVPDGKSPNAKEDATLAANPFFGVAPFNLTNAMTKLLALGLPLADVIATVTSGPARMIGLADELGALRPGRVADISVLDLMPGRFELRDNSGEVVVAPEMLTPLFALKSGKRFDVDSPLVPTPHLLAA